MNGSSRSQGQFCKEAQSHPEPPMVSSGQQLTKASVLALSLLTIPPTTGPPVVHEKSWAGQEGEERGSQVGSCHGEENKPVATEALKPGPEDFHISELKPGDVTSVVYTEDMFSQSLMLWLPGAILDVLLSTVLKPHWAKVPRTFTTFLQLADKAPQSSKPSSNGLLPGAFTDPCASLSSHKSTTPYHPASQSSSQGQDFSSLIFLSQALHIKPNK
ncbi:hypothetical protein MJT46_018937 [Ovis ammon polii x Ovis aries]|nr:hypothetical protein MJT46_018937 [Ovis ammon polii x Ovis aries]